MFRRKSKETSAQADPGPPVATTNRAGYVVTEVPTYHSGKRKIVVYTSDAQGRIVKSYKKG